MADRTVAPYAIGTGMRQTRLLLGTIAMTFAAACAVVLVAPGSGSGGERAAAGRSLPAVDSLAVLRRWDAGRARAWARADSIALGSLYTPGSAAGARDAEMLRQWSDRGLRVEEMQTQVLAARVVRRTPDEMVLEVTDRLAHAVAAGRGTRVELPADRATSRTVTLRRVGGTWLVAAVLVR